jgi:hypothetical protein
MNRIIYQALLSNPENIARIQAAQRAIETAGGHVRLAAAQRVGMMLVTLDLPADVRPEMFFPDLPFYPV